MLAVAAAVAIAAVAILAMHYSDIRPSRASEIAEDNDRQQSEHFGIQWCDEVAPQASIVDSRGFVTHGDAQQRQTLLERQLVLELGSTGYITMEYDFCANTTGALEANPSYTLHNRTELQERFDSYNSTNHGISRFNPEKLLPDENILRYGPLGSMVSPPVHIPSIVSIPEAAGTGIMKSAANLTKIDDHTVQVIYIIAAEPDAERTSYIIGLYKICPGLILTIGDEPNYEEPIIQDWANGPFYGCHG